MIHGLNHCYNLVNLSMRLYIHPPASCVAYYLWCITVIVKVPSSSKSAIKFSFSNSMYLPRKKPIVIFNQFSWIFLCSPEVSESFFFRYATHFILLSWQIHTLECSADFFLSLNVMLSKASGSRSSYQFDHLNVAFKCFFLNTGFFIEMNLLCPCSWRV